MKKETKTLVLRIVIVIAITAALVAAVAFQKKEPDSGVIYIFGGDGGNAWGIEGYASGSVAVYEKKALLVTTNTFLPLDENGAGESTEISVNNPEVITRGKYALVYDKNGYNFSVYKSGKRLYGASSNFAIVAGKVNENGYVVTVGESEGGETPIMVYNAKGTAFYSWKLGSGEFIDVDICDDNTRIVISSIGSNEDELNGQLTVVSLDKESKAASGVTSDEIYLKVRISRDYTIAALGTEKLDYYNPDCTLRWNLPYDERTIRNADIDDHGSMVLCYAPAANGLVGNTTEIEIVNRMGEITASASFDGLCENLSVSGEYFGVSAGKKIYVYNMKCELGKELVSNAAVKKLVVYRGGKSVFVMSDSGGCIIK